jgi:hypothetical protein
VSWNLAQVTCVSEKADLLRLGTNCALERATKVYTEGLTIETCIALTLLDKTATGSLQGVSSKENKTNVGLLQT